MFDYVAVMGGLFVTSTVFVIFSFCIILVYFNCVVSFILCFCFFRVFRVGFRKVFCRSMVVRYFRGVGGVGMVMEFV